MLITVHQVEHVLLIGQNTTLGYTNDTSSVGLFFCEEH